MEEYIMRTMENLRKNNMDAFYAETAEDAKNLLESMLKEGDEITCGGSVTLYRSGILDMLKSGKYRYYDRFAPGITPEEAEKIYRKAFTCDAYISSANAVTERGELYNVDGNSNRVAAIMYGPENVYIIAGKNKIVPDINEAIKRVKTAAAPKNSARLKCKTPCAVTGECISLKRDNPFMCDGCESEGRICCSYTVSAHQRKKGRIKVIIIGEDIGY